MALFGTNIGALCSILMRINKKFGARTRLLSACRHVAKVPLSEQSKVWSVCHIAPHLQPQRWRIMHLKVQPAPSKKKGSETATSGCMQPRRPGFPYKAIQGLALCIKFATSFSIIVGLLLYLFTIRIRKNLKWQTLT